MIYYRGRWLIEPEIKALLTKLEDLNKELRSEADRVLRENTVLREKQESDDRQIAEYDDELRKAKKLLRAAVEGFDNCADRCICDYCDSRCPFYNFGCVSGWKHRDEALALIGEEGDTND